MTSLSETLRDLSPTDRVRAQLDRIPDSDAVTLDKDDVRALVDGWQDAGIHADAAWDAFCRARTPIEQASAIVDMNNAMSDLASWLPGYNAKLGRVPYADELDSSGG